jgi:Protein of unknown function (DUF4054)
MSVAGTPFPVPFDTTQVFTPVDEKQFRHDFAEFADPVAYTSITVRYWLAVSQRLNNPCVWQDLLPLGIELLAAHFITIEAQALKAGLTGGNPGIAGFGPISNKSVDRVSIGYGVQMAQEQGAGSYNATTYGQRWWHFAQIFGAGAIQL